jgi:hypothetical protein
VNVLTPVLWLAAVGLSLAAVFVYQILPFVPRVGLRALYHVRRVRLAVALTALTLALAAGRRARSKRGWLPLAIVGVLTPLSGAVHAARILVPLDDPDNLPADEANIDEETMVVGIELDGRAHAWQVQTLVPHHVVHDRVGDRPVVAAWCAVCNSGVVYDGTLDGRELHFDPEAVWRENMVMRDRETGTLWQHATGEALVGPLAGSALDVLGGRLMTWGAWRTDHPETTLTRDPTDREWRGVLSKETTSRVLADGGLLTTFVSRLARRDDRLGPLTEVVGVEVDGNARAYPLAVLEAQETVVDDLGDVQVRISYDTSRNRVVVETTDGAVAFRRTRWLEWVEFHSHTSVYTAPTHD